MPRAKNTPQSIAKKIKEGFGQGEGIKYKPWITGRSFPSRGLSSRIFSPKCGRILFTLSKLESNTARLYDLHPNCKGIREQFALLPLEETMAIAKALGVKHPQDPFTKHNIVMTTDFVFTMKPMNNLIMIARAIKYAKELSDPRVLEKLEMERLYWQVRNVDWGIITEKFFSPGLIANINLLHPRQSIIDLAPRKIISQVTNLLFREVNSDWPLRQITKKIDSQLEIKPGTSLAVTYHLIASGKWSIDLSQKIDTNKSLKILLVEG